MKHHYLKRVKQQKLFLNHSQQPLPRRILYQQIQMTTWPLSPFFQRNLSFCICSLRENFAAALINWIFWNFMLPMNPSRGNRLKIEHQKKKKKKKKQKLRGVYVPDLVPQNKNLSIQFSMANFKSLKKGSYIVYRLRKVKYFKLIDVHLLVLNNLAQLRFINASREENTKNIDQIVGSQIVYAIKTSLNFYGFIGDWTENRILSDISLLPQIHFYFDDNKCMLILSH